MKIVYKNQTKKFQNSEVCAAFEYPMDDKDINGAVIELSGRYPGEGRIMNEICREMAYVIKGSGKIIIEGKEVELAEGDLALVEPGEKYFWDGNLILFIASNPAWYPEQHKLVD